MFTENDDATLFGAATSEHLDAREVSRVVVAGRIDVSSAKRASLAGNRYDTFIASDAISLGDDTSAAGNVVSLGDDTPVGSHTTSSGEQAALLQAGGRLTSVDALLAATREGAALRAAEAAGLRLLQEIEAAQVLRPGRSERDMSEAICALARQHDPSVHKFWHKRIVRVGRNTQVGYAANPPDAALEDDDIAFVDIGPVLGTTEADLGRTYVFGNDAEKHRLAADLAPIFAAGQALYRRTPQMTGGELYARVVELCTARGWSFAQHHCGHLVGEFPHSRHFGDAPENWICADNHTPMSAPGPEGRLRHWILEIHINHVRRPFGAFFEQLLASW